MYGDFSKIKINTEGKSLAEIARALGQINRINNRIKREEERRERQRQKMENQDTTNRTPTEYPNYILGYYGLGFVLLLWWLAYQIASKTIVGPIVSYIIVIGIVSAVVLWIVEKISNFVSWTVNLVEETKESVEQAKIDKKEKELRKIQKMVYEKELQRQIGIYKKKLSRL